MKSYSLLRDIPAGFVVFLVALPLCLGIAQASGLPPFVGLLTGVIGGLVVSALSPSKFAVSGPAAGLVTIVVSAIETLGSFAALLSALILAGIIQFLFGVLRAGRFITLVPSSVVKGMLAAIGILLIIQQIPIALGASVNSKLISMITNGQFSFSVIAIVISLISLFILAIWAMPIVKNNNILNKVPGPLVAVVFGCLVVVFGKEAIPNLNETLPRISLPAFDSFPSLIGELERPDWNVWHNPAIYIIAFTLAFVASLETLLSQEALKKLRPQNPPPSPDKEMRAQGVGNILSGFLGGLPITAVIVRGSVNVSAGAQSKLSVLLHAVLLLICGLWFSELLNTIPLASLAAILIYTGYKLATPRLFVEQIRQGAQQWLPFLATVGGIIFFGMLMGITIGIVTKMLCSIYKSHGNALQLTRYEDHFVLRFQQNLTFLHNLRLQGMLAKIPDNSTIIVEHDNAEYLDPDVEALLKDFSQDAYHRGIKLSQWPVKEAIGN